MIDWKTLARVSGIAAFAALLGAFALPAPLHAQDYPVAARAADIVAVLRNERQVEEVFAPAFLGAVSKEQLAQITAQLVASAGAVERAEDVEDRGKGAASFAIRFERARGEAVLQLDSQAPYKVVGFRITGMAPLSDKPADMDAQFSALPGQTSYGIYRLGDDGPELVSARNADMPFAIGSTFKLYVLSALTREIAAGRHAWDEVVPLTVKSLPSGQMQNWPKGAPVTLHTLATLMISISDNTATDMLVTLLGRPAIEAEVAASGHAEPARLRPFMTTAELFALKLAASPVQQRYLMLDESGKRQLLEGLDLAAISGEQVNSVFANGPVALPIEWYASAKDIAHLFDRIRQSGDATALAILGVNPSASAETRAKWGYVGYKGGSEPGVLNLSWLLRNKAGQWLAVTASWNDSAAVLDQKRFELLTAQLLALAQGAGD